jgi:hypothetical protein
MLLIIILTQFTSPYLIKLWYVRSFILHRNTNPHWARVVAYSPFSLCVILKACAPAVGTLIGWCPKFTYISLTLHPRRGSRGISNIPPRHPLLTKLVSYEEHCRRGGKPIAVLLQSSGASAINPLVAFYDIHGGKREVLFFYFVPDTTRALNLLCPNHYIRAHQIRGVEYEKPRHLVEIILRANYW